MWQELGVVQNQEFYYHDEIVRIESGEKSLDVCTDPVRLKQQMIALSPEDSRLIEELVSLFTGRSMMGAMSLKPAEMSGIIDKVKMIAALIPLLGTFRKYGNQTIQEFAKRFKDPFLRNAVRFFVDSPGWPMLRFPMVALSGFVKSSVLEAGAPLGGSQKIVFHMADFYNELGGDMPVSYTHLRAHET